MQQVSFVEIVHQADLDLLNVPHVVPVIFQMEYYAQNALSNVLLALISMFAQTALIMLTEFQHQAVFV